MVDLKALAIAVIDGQRDEAVRLVEQACVEGIEPGDILHRALIPAMAVVGERFRCNDIYVPEVLISARAMKSAMAVLEPRLKAGGVQKLGKVVIGTVKGDLHDIGKNLVGMMLQGRGYEVVDLGTDVSAERFIAACKEHNAKIIGLSALLTTTMPYMVMVRQAIQEAGLPDIKIMIGGAPVTQQFADENGIDGYAPDAATAVEVVQRLLQPAA